MTTGTEGRATFVVCLSIGPENTVALPFAPHTDAARRCKLSLQLSNCLAKC